MAPPEFHALGACMDTTHPSKENSAFCFDSTPMVEDSGQVQEDLVALFDRQINMGETALCGDQRMQLPLWNQSKPDATQCLHHSPYTALKECMKHSANSSCDTMKSFDNDSPMDCGIDSWPLSAEQPQVFEYALSEQRLPFPRDLSIYRGYSSSVNSPAVEGQPYVYFKMHENRQISSVETADGLEDLSRRHPPAETGTNSSTQNYLGDGDDLEYAESYMITGYETLSEAL